MTIRLPKRGPGFVRKFTGTKGEAARNRLSHAWRQVTNPVDQGETIGICDACRATSNSCAAEWPCGRAEVLGPGEHEW